MKYTKPLIISDNLKLCLSFIGILKELDLEEEKFHFGISKYSSVEVFRREFSSIQVFDLKIEQDVEKILASYDLVISLHCKQIFPSKLVDGLKCINVHPGYNPINRGWYPQVFAIIHDLSIGATIHEIDNELDHGPIIDRALVEKFEHDTSESLYNRILEKELELIRNNLGKILNGTYEAYLDNESVSNLFLKSDFNDLLEIDLDASTTYREVINRFRATSHGPFLNTYFKNSKGEKVYIKFGLSVDN